MIWCWIIQCELFKLTILCDYVPKIYKSILSSYSGICTVSGYWNCINLFPNSIFLVWITSTTNYLQYFVSTTKISLSTYCIPINSSSLTWRCNTRPTTTPSVPICIAWTMNICLTNLITISNSIWAYSKSTA